MNVFWDRNFIYPQWLHNDPIVIPKAKLSAKLHQMIPKSHQTDPKITRLAQLFVPLASPSPSWTSKISRKNVYFLFKGPLGADNATIKPATTRIIPAIRRLYAQSGPKVSPKMVQKCPQSHLHMPKVVPKWPQSDPKATHVFVKWLKSIGKMCVFFNRPKYTQSDATMIPKQSESNTKSPEYTQSDLKVAPKWPKTCSVRLAGAFLYNTRCRLDPSRIF